MAKIQLKSDNINPFGGLFSIFSMFNRSGLRSVIDGHLGRRGRTKAAFTHGDVFASMFGGYLCGGDCIEDVMDIKPFWDNREDIRVCSSDVILRTLRGLSEDSVCYESGQGKSYAFNVNERMNTLLLKCLAATGQLNPGDCVDLDFDHQFIAADKKDAKYSYKKADGYFPGVASIGGIIAGVENRDGNANVRFHQADTLERLFNRLEKHARVVVRNFRADCGSFSEEILVVVSSHCEHFYIRASNCQSRYVEFMEHEDWTEAEIGGQKCGVTSLRFDTMLPDMNLRLVVQRTPVTDEDPDAEPEGIFGTEYIYRCIVTNDWDSSERDIISYYNQRGASERNFDCQNNDFGWAHMPFSFLKENTVFLIATAILKNFYLHLLGVISGRVKGLDKTARLKRFLRMFVIVPAKWTRSGRRNVLSLYTKRRVYLELGC